MFRTICKIFVLLVFSLNTHSIVFASSNMSDDYLSTEVGEFKEAYQNRGLPGLFEIENFFERVKIVEFELLFNRGKFFGDTLKSNYMSLRENLIVHTKFFMRVAQLQMASLAEENALLNAFYLNLRRLNTILYHAEHPFSCRALSPYEKQEITHLLNGEQITIFKKSLHCNSTDPYEFFNILKDYFGEIQYKSRISIYLTKKISLMDEANNHWLDWEVELLKELAILYDNDGKYRFPFFFNAPLDHTYDYVVQTMGYKNYTEVYQLIVKPFYDDGRALNPFVPPWGITRSQFYENLNQSRFLFYTSEKNLERTVQKSVKFLGHLTLGLPTTLISGVYVLGIYARYPWTKPSIKYDDDYWTFIVTSSYTPAFVLGPFSFEGSGEHTLMHSYHMAIDPLALIEILATYAYNGEHHGWVEHIEWNINEFDHALNLENKSLLKWDLHEFSEYWRNPYLQNELALKSVRDKILIYLSILIEQDELKNKTLKNLIHTTINKSETIQAD